jgi:hypothetical protein
VTPGTLLTRNDSSIHLSPPMYREHVKPRDARLARELGTSSFHSCGKWDHLVDDALDLPGVRGLDLGNPEMMDLKTIHGKARARGATLLGLQPTREDLVTGAAARACPTGVVLSYAASSFEDARHVTEHYYRRTAS